MDILTDSGRVLYADKKISSDVENTKLENINFLRLIAKDKNFTKVDFKYTIFDNCYLRKCSFDSCNFTGCKFVGSNFSGSKFDGCIFDYAIFEKTNINSDILDNCCPSHENIKQSFARSLRTNYQQLGESRSANKAINVELAATKTHLYKGWRSNDSYYRHHYKGLDRVKMFLLWLEHMLLDIIWGHGESLLKMLLSVLIMLVLIACMDFYITKNDLTVSALWRTFSLSPAIFLGIASPPEYSKLYLAIITFFRLIALGFFISIIIKRFNRR